MSMVGGSIHVSVLCVFRLLFLALRISVTVRSLSVSQCQSLCLNCFRVVGVMEALPDSMPRVFLVDPTQNLHRTPRKRVSDPMTIPNHCSIVHEWRHLESVTRESALSVTAETCFVVVTEAVATKLRFHGSCLGTRGQNGFLPFVSHRTCTFA